MKYIAKEDLDCKFGILKVGDSFEADPKDMVVAQLMIAGKIVAEDTGEKTEPKKSRKNANKAEKEEVAEEASETEPSEDTNEDKE